MNLQEEFENGNITTADRYLEPGYSLPEGSKGILLANWNNYTSEQMDAIEEEYEVEWSDEWMVVEGAALRTEPSDWWWKPSYRVTRDGEVLTVESDIEDWIHEAAAYDISHNPETIPSNYELDDIDFKKFGKSVPTAKVFDKDKTPKDVLVEILVLSPNAQVVFQEAGLEWQAYYRTEEDQP